MAMPTKQVSDVGLFVFKERYDHLKFLKRQAWTITNYVVLIYAPIFSAEHFSSNAPFPPHVVSQSRGNCRGRVWPLAPHRY
jgi:hypothetical protein